jgi:hypothetical protein
MGIGNTLKRVASYGFKRKNVKNIRKKLGLTSANKFARQLKRSFRGFKSGDVVSSSAPTSAPSYYHQARTLSQLTGGV